MIGQTPVTTTTTTTTTQERRNMLTALAAMSRGAGNHDAAARIELAREYFTNPEFRGWLEETVWQINQGRVA